MSGCIGTGNHANGKFFNPGPKRAPKVDADNPGLISRLLTKRPDSVRPKDPIPVHPLTRPDLESRRGEPETHLYRLGHSTILMKFGHDYWITDPVFCERTSPSQKFGPKRFHAPPLTVSDLPKIAVVVISHNHYDHLDRATIRALAPSVEQFIVPLGVARYLQKWGVEPGKIVELDWWQSHAQGDVEITATPSQHFSGRGLHDRNKSLWASFVFRHAGEQVFFSSDSGYFHGFRQIAERFGRFAVSMLECGAWDVAWPDVHMTPEECVQAHEDLGGGVLMPIHNATFSLAFHSWKEPFERLDELAMAGGHTLLTPNIGQQVVVGVPVVQNPWWAGLE